MVAALGNLQVRKMFGREAYALCGHEVHVGIVRLGQMLMHRVHHFVGSMWPSHSKDFGVSLLHHAFFRTQASGHDNLAVFREGFTDCV
jgi:hypothetical protein